MILLQWSIDFDNETFSLPPCTYDVGKLVPLVGDLVIVLCLVRALTTLERNFWVLAFFFEAETLKDLPLSEYKEYSIIQYQGNAIIALQVKCPMAFFY